MSIIYRQDGHNVSTTFRRFFVFSPFLIKTIRYKPQTAISEQKVTTEEASNSRNTQSDFFIADWRVEPKALRIFRANQEVRLEPRVMQVLVYLAGRPGEVVSREDLEVNVWTGRVVGYDAVSNTVIKLRKAFGDSSRNPQIIETIPKTGYRL